MPVLLPLFHLCYSLTSPSLVSDLSQHYMCATQNNSPFTASWLVFHSFPTCSQLFSLHWLLLLIQVPCGPVFQGYKSLEFSICLKLLVWCYRILWRRASYSAWKFKSFSSTALNKTASGDICVWGVYICAAGCRTHIASARKLTSAWTSWLHLPL